MPEFTVNGENRRTESAVSIAGVLRGEGVDPDDARGIAVALNDAIVRRGEWKETNVPDGARVEIVTARQGG